jgi:hypothetical protein
MKKRFESLSPKIKTPDRSFIRAGFLHVESTSDFSQSLSMVFATTPCRELSLHWLPEALLPEGRLPTRNITHPLTPIVMDEGSLLLSIDLSRKPAQLSVAGKTLTLLQATMLASFTCYRSNDYHEN